MDSYDVRELNQIAYRKDTDISDEALDILPP